MSDNERAVDPTAEAGNDVLIVAGFLWASVDFRLRQFMKVANIQAEDGDRRRLLITFASGARVRIAVEIVEDQPHAGQRNAAPGVIE